MGVFQPGVMESLKIASAAASLPFHLPRLLVLPQRLIPFNERHLQMTVRDWAIHYNRGRPHSALGPGLPEPMPDQVPPNEHRHKLPVGYRVVKRAVLGFAS